MSLVIRGILPGDTTTITLMKNRILVQTSVCGGALTAFSNTQASLAMGLLMLVYAALLYGNVLRDLIKTPRLYALSLTMYFALPTYLAIKEQVWSLKFTENFFDWTVLLGAPAGLAYMLVFLGLCLWNPKNASVLLKLEQDLLEGR